MTTEQDKETTVATSPTNTSREQIVAMLTRRQEAYDDLDAAALAEDYAEDVVIESPMSGTHGKAEAEKFLRAFFGAFLDLTMTFAPPIIDGEQVALIGTADGTNMGGFMGLPPSGRSFKVQTALIYQVKGGKIVREQRIYDFTGMLVQIGLLKAKPA
jgi:steroid delta-isomerase-like uncharacterized protein